MKKYTSKNGVHRQGVHFLASLICFMIVLKRIFLYCLFLIKAISDHAQNDLRSGRNRRCQTDVKQRNSFHSAHQINRRDPDAECPHDTLHHDENSFFTAVKISYKAKQHGREQTVDGVCLQVIMSKGDHFLLAGENGRQ